MTKVTFAGLFCTLVGLLALAGTVSAAEATQTPHAYAVLIGISTYTDKAIQPRPHAEDDVKALYDVLTNKDYLGLDRNHIRLLLGGSADAERHSQPATKENILKAAHWLAASVKRDDLVIFAFVGQGAVLGEHSDRACYLASDSRVKDLGKSAVLASALEEEMDKVASRHLCALADVYFKGYTPVGGGAPPDLNRTGAIFPEFLGHEAGEEGTPATGRVLFLATSGLYLSPDLEKHGSFMQVVLDGLKGKADREGKEQDGTVTVDELTEYLTKELNPLVQAHGGPDKEHIHHFVLSGEDAHFALTRNPAVAAAVKDRLEKFAALAKENKKITPEIRLEGENLLAHMPRLEAQRSLRKEYQQLVDGKKDVDAFLAQRTKILESTKLAGQVARDFAEKVIDATKLIARDYVKEENQGELVEWAIRGLFRRLDEKVPEDLSTKLAKAKEMKERELLTLLKDVRMRLGKREDLDKHKDIDNALDRMLRHLDPYTIFYDPDSLEREKGQISGRFIGVGIQIRKDQNTDQLLVITPIMGSPAFKAGIQAGDLITTITRKVDSYGKPLENPEVIPTKGLDLSEAVKKILGQPNTPVQLTVTRKGEDKPRDFDMVRTMVSVETVLGTHRKADASWDYWLDPAKKIGYIRLTQFTRSSFADMKKVMARLKEEGVKGLVLDLRFNPGGLLDSARDISDLFIDDGVIVSIRPRVGKEYVMYGTRKEPISSNGIKKETGNVDIPMVCLVNGLSASGSEIVSACLQDHHRALIMGERSYGKGSVQNVEDFEKENGEVKSQIKLTTASFWRPSGKNLNKASTSGKPEEDWGVIPDKTIKLSAVEREELLEHQRNQETIQPSGKAAPAEKNGFKDRQLDTALEYLQGQIKLAGKLPQRKAG